MSKAIKDNFPQPDASVQDLEVRKRRERIKNKALHVHVQYACGSTPTNTLPWPNLICMSQQDNPKFVARRERLKNQAKET